MDQWNVRPPVLYLWSRRDWTHKHTAIAQEHGHLWLRKQAHSEKENASDTLRVRQLEESEKGKSSDLLRHRQQEDSGMGKGSDKGKNSDLSRHRQQEGSGMVKVSDKEKSSDLSTHRQQEDSGMGKGSDISMPKQLESEKGVRSKTSANDIHEKESTILAPDEPEDSKSESFVSGVPKNGSTKTWKRDSDRESHDNRDIHPNLSPEAPRKKRQRFEEIPRRGDGETSEESRRNCKRPLTEIKQRPPASPNVSDHTSSKSVEMPPYADVDGIGHHQQSGSTMTEPNTNLGAPYDAAQISLTDDITRKYNLNAEESYPRGNTGWSNNASPMYDIGSRHVEERILDQMGGRVGLNYKPYSTGVDTYMRDSEIRSHIRHYGHPDTDNLRSNYQVGPDPRYSRIGAIPASYGHLGTFSEPSRWMNTSATQRYMPRLDELNHTRLGGMGVARQMNGGSTFDPRVHTSSGFRGVSQGFAPGPQYPYSNQNSAGWLNE